MMNSTYRDSRDYNTLSSRVVNEAMYEISMRFKDQELRMTQEMYYMMNRQMATATPIGSPTTNPKETVEIKKKSEKLRNLIAYYYQRK